MKKKLLGLLFGSALVLAACGGGEETAPADETNGADGGDNAAAQALYDQSCASCHGGNLEGGVGPALTDMGLSAGEIQDIIENGQGSMPAGLLQGEEAAQVSEWLAAK